MTNCCCGHGPGDNHAVAMTGLLERPLYAPGLILEDADLTAAVDYTRQLNRLLFGALFGCGVICGLTVTVDTDCDLQVTVDPGLALDGCGDPIQLVRPATLTLGRADHVLPGRDGEPPERKSFWITLCGKEKPCAKRALVCDGDGFDAASAPTRARSLAEVSISFDRPDCICECRPRPPGDRTPFDVDGFVEALLPKRMRVREGQDETPEPREDPCQTDHNTRVACAADCGCGSACSCGCCVLLALVYWFEAEQAWGVIHNGVRRFVRPAMLPDPMQDKRPAAVHAQPQAQPEPIARGQRPRGGRVVTPRGGQPVEPA
jgi:hypothetical protein